MRYKTDDCVIEDGTLIRVNSNSQEVVIPYGVKKIGSSVFQYNNLIKTISTHSNQREIKYTVLEVQEEKTTKVALHFEKIIADSIGITIESTIETKEKPYDSRYKLRNALRNIVNNEIYEAYPLNLTTSDTVTLPKGLEVIGEFAFSECRRLENITIPKGVKEISYKAFADCTSLYAVTLLDGLEVIGYGAFSGCTYLHTVILPDGLKKIGNYAFSGCRSLKKIIIPDSVTDIGEMAFSDCENLEEVTLPKNLEMLDTSVFYRCRSLKKLNNYSYNTKIYCSLWFKDRRDDNPILPVKFMNLGLDGCFTLEEYHDYHIGKYKNYSVLEKVIIPEKSEMIAAYTFKSCTSLINVVMPDSLKTIYFAAFSGCTSLQNLILPNNISQIYSYAFYRCTSLENIILPDNLRWIGEKAFGYCENLKEITIPYNVTSTGKDVFYGCKNLRKITFVCKNFKDKKRVQELSKEMMNYYNANFDGNIEIRFESIYEYNKRKEISISLINDKLNVQTNMQIIDRENCLPQYEISGAKEDDLSDCNAHYDSTQHAKTTGKKVRKKRKYKS